MGDHKRVYLRTRDKLQWNISEVTRTVLNQENMTSNWGSPEVSGPIWSILHPNDLILFSWDWLCVCSLQSFHSLIPPTSFRMPNIRVLSPPSSPSSDSMGKDPDFETGKMQALTPGQLYQRCMPRKGHLTPLSPCSSPGGEANMIYFRAEVVIRDTGLLL